MIAAKKYTYRNSQIGQFIAKAMLLLLAVFIIDRAIGALLNHFYFTQKSGVEYNTTFAMEQNKAGLVIFGSSRAKHHYQPTVFERELKMGYYNAGRDGNYMFYHLAVLQSTLKRYTPKMVILDFMDIEFEEGEQSYDRLSALLPYYKTHPEIRSIVDKKSRFEKLKLLSAIYPYNSLLLAIAKGNKNISDTTNPMNNGYEPLHRVWTGAQVSRKQLTDHALDSNKIAAFEAFLDESRRAGCSVFIVCSPYFGNNRPETATIKKAKELAAKRNIPFLDYSQNKFFGENAAYFADPDHLNDQGAIVFSEKLVEEIRQSGVLKGK